MDQRITLADLTAVIDRINKATSSPLTPYTTDAAGRLRGNIGNFHLSRAYGGYCLHRMATDGGGVSDVFYCGHTTAGDLYKMMHGLLAGLRINEGEK